MTADPDATSPVPPRGPDRCTGCGRCVAACPERILTLETTGRRKHAFLTDPQRCSGCGRCFQACPFTERDRDTQDLENADQI